MKVMFWYVWMFLLTLAYHPADIRTSAPSCFDLPRFPDIWPRQTPSFAVLLVMGPINTHKIAIRHLEKLWGKNAYSNRKKYRSTCSEPLESCHKIVSAAVPCGRTRRPNNWMWMIRLDTTVLCKPNIVRVQSLCQWHMSFPWSVMIFPFKW